MTVSEAAARIRVPLGFVVAILVLYLATPSGVSLLLGIPVALVGLVFRAAAAGVIRKDTVLARDGPYRLTRNPLYFGSFLLAMGFAITSGNALAATLLLVPSLLIYPGIIRREEAHLQRRFGRDFEHFRQSVPGFLPRRLSPDLLESFSTEQYLNNREYNALIGFVGATGVLILKYLLD